MDLTRKYRYAVFLTLRNDSCRRCPVVPLGHIPRNDAWLPRSKNFRWFFTSCQSSAQSSSLKLLQNGFVTSYKDWKRCDDIDSVVKHFDCILKPEDCELPRDNRLSLSKKYVVSNIAWYNLMMLLIIIAWYRLWRILVYRRLPIPFSTSPQNTRIAIAAFIAATDILLTIKHFYTRLVRDGHLTR